MQCQGAIWYFVGAWLDLFSIEKMCNDIFGWLICQKEDALLSLFFRSHALIITVFSFGRQKDTELAPVWMFPFLLANWFDWLRPFCQYPPPFSTFSSLFSIFYLAKSQFVIVGTLYFIILIVIFFLLSFFVTLYFIFLIWSKLSFIVIIIFCQFTHIIKNIWKNVGDKLVKKI